MGISRPLPTEGGAAIRPRASKAEQKCAGRKLDPPEDPHPPTLDPRMIFHLETFLLVGSTNI